MSDEFEEDYEVYRERIREAPMDNRSLSIAALADALAKAQGEITGALKDSANPFFKSKYADLASCWDACRSALSKNGLAVIQLAESDAEAVSVTTTLAHSSGEWVSGTLRMTPKDSTPQAFGSAITYARRYALAAMVGVAQVDDDGNNASGKDATSKAYTEVRGDMTETLPKGKADEYAAQMRSYFDKGDATGLLALDLELKAVSTDARVQVYDICKFNSQEKVKFRAFLADAHKKAPLPLPPP